jgi:uncharacterized protein involved in exopolysaccharide biosynthesis
MTNWKDRDGAQAPASHAALDHIDRAIQSLMTQKDALQSRLIDAAAIEGQLAEVSRQLTLLQQVREGFLNAEAAPE